MSDLLYRLLQQDEALRLEPYRDSEGFWTIGYGHLIDSRKGGKLPAWVTPSFPITAETAQDILLEDISNAQRDLSMIIDTSGFGEVRQAVFGSMVFQMGAPTLKAFVNTLAAARAHDWPNVAQGIRNSVWYRQTPARAERLARAVESGDVKELAL